MTAPVPLGLCGQAFQGEPLGKDVGCTREVNTAALIVEIGARLRARAILRCGGLNEANCAVHAALWRLLRHGVDLASMSENDLQAAINKISQT